MSWAETLKAFLDRVQEIAKSKPAYKQPGDGMDGTCDCIGLAIGAIRRMGLKWTGIHGCNWAARKELDDLQKITGTTDLQPGDLVLKAHGPGEKGYDLPARYKKGGKYYTGDLKDYYHAGVVTGTNPLRITHMTSPTIKVDTGLGNWEYHGRLNILLKAAGEPVKTTADSQTADMPTAGVTAIVTAENGKAVKMRQYPSSSCRTWEALPCGTKVEINAPGEEWAKISFGRRRGWYMKAEFLDIVGDGKGKY